MNPPNSNSHPTPTVSSWRTPTRPHRLNRLMTPAHRSVAIRLTLFSLFSFIPIALFAGYYWNLSSTYNLDEVGAPASGTLIYDNQGKELPSLNAKNQKRIQRNEIPTFFVNALCAREDARFFSHNGVDISGLLRATARNIKDRSFTQGASTLSMQLTRNSFGIKQKSLHRKFLEIALTLRVEARYSKDEILTHYLNRIYFGAGAYGIESAAQTYFSKNTRNLNDAESALLVGIIRGPHLFSPSRRPQAAVDQRNQTLNRMLDMGFIDVATRDRLSHEALQLSTSEQDSNQTSYAIQAVERELNAILDDDVSPTGTIHVYTTLHSAWQDRIELELNQALLHLERERSWAHPTYQEHVPGTNTDYLQYAAITTESKTGAILALIGGRNFNHSRVDRTRSNRDLGSAFEPFVALAASDRGKLIFPDSPVLTGRQIGPSEVARIAKRCGINGPFSKTEDLFRGAVAASPLEMSTALATLANQGKRPKPYLIKEIRDASGTSLYRAKPQLKQAVHSAPANEAKKILQETSGTRSYTGATGSERDAWTLRIGPSGSTAIWLGFDQPKAIATKTRLDQLIEEFAKRLGNE